MAKKIRMRPFAPNGLLTDVQTEQLKAWYQDGENRKISQRAVAEATGINRMTLRSSFEKNPDRPFDEIVLKKVNKLIEVYNEDIQRKDEEDEKVEKTKKNKDLAKQLIEKVDK